MSPDWKLLFFLLLGTTLFLMGWVLWKTLFGRNIYIKNNTINQRKSLILRKLGTVAIVIGTTIYLLSSFVNHAARDAVRLNSYNTPPPDGFKTGQYTTVNKLPHDNTSVSSENDENGYHGHGWQFGAIMSLLQKGQVFDNSPHYWQVANAAVKDDGVIMILGKCLVDNRLQEISDMKSGNVRQSDNDGMTILYECGQIFTNYEATICPSDPAPCDGYGQQAAYYAEHEIK